MEKMGKYFGTICVWACTLSICISTVAFGDAKEFYFERYRYRLEEQASANPLLKWLPPGMVPDRVTVQEKNFEQRLDHDSCCDFTVFKQRYFVDSSLAKGNNAPVLLYICGEATCEPRNLQGAIREHAEKLGAHLVALEHRYYGKSQPFKKLTVANLKYLTTNYALKDLATFQIFMKSQLEFQGKWISVGGSYPGSLSAYYREKLSEIVVGALASSAPVRAEANFEEYDHHVATVAGTECAAKIREVALKIDSFVGKPEMAEVKKLFAAEAVKDDVDFVYIVADVAASAVQYGFHKGFCQALKGNDPLKAYGDFAKSVYQMFGMDARRMSMFEGAISENPEDYLEGFGYRQWIYQSCTEYGYWQNAYHDAAISVRSPRINAEYHNNLCKRLFGQERPVSTTFINDNFFHPLMMDKKASQVLMTNGSNDPWSKLSISGEVKNPGLTLQTIEGAAHCDDLRASKLGDSESLKKARATFLRLAEEWLK